MLGLSKLTALTRLTWLPWVATAEEDPLAGPPLEFETQDGDLFMTADDVYFGVTEA